MLLYRWPVPFNHLDGIPSINSVYLLNYEYSVTRSRNLKKQPRSCMSISHSCRLILATISKSCVRSCKPRTELTSSTRSMGSVKVVLHMNQTCKYEHPFIAKLNQLHCRRDDKNCAVCLHAKIDTIFLPCKHMCLCYNCAKEFKKRFDHRCPMCRRRNSHYKPYLIHFYW